jgi:hypothetical protein
MANTGGGFYDHTIDQSLRFNDNDGPYLSRTFGTPTNAKINTISFWYKRGTLSTDQRIFTDTGTGPYVGADETMGITRAGVGTWRTTALLRDPTAWYHVVFKVDNTQSTIGTRIKIYLNGELQTGQGQTVFSQNEDCYYATSGTKYISGPTYLIDGYIADFHFIDGQALDPTSFGEFKSGTWIPKEYSGTYGNNGFHLEFANSGSLGTDTSGNGNTFSAYNLASTDVTLDSPTNNFATLSSIEAYSNSVTTYYQGNLEASLGNASNWRSAIATVQPNSGKWYYEVVCENNYNGFAGFGYDNFDMNGSNSYLTATAGSFAYFVSGGIRNNNSQIASATALSTGDIVGIALDIDAGQAKWYRNGSLEATTSFTAGSQCKLGFSNVAGVLWSINFGQDSSFNGYKTAQGNTDANGIGDFYYAPPSGYLALCTANLPEPAISPADDASPSDHFSTILWTGDGTTSRTISGVGFQPDVTWIKKRNGALNNAIWDVQRGGNYQLYPDSTNAEWYATDRLQSFASDGFTVGNSDYTNGSGSTYVAWNWKADNTSGSTNTDGTITSTVSANVDAGFSIVSYTANGTTGATVGHGLSQAPDVVIAKNRTRSGYGWLVGHSGVGFSKGFAMNLADAQYNDSNLWHSDPTSSVFYLGGDTYANYSGDPYIAYCFHSVDGYSKFGAYQGNGSTDGTFVYTGFRPAFIISKRVDSSDAWRMYDSVRSEYNASTKVLYPNYSYGEDASTDHFDWLSNGFKCRSNNMNVSGGTYIYMAFAENPFKYSTAV